MPFPNMDVFKAFQFHLHTEPAKPAILDSASPSSVHSSVSSVQGEGPALMDIDVDKDNHTQKQEGNLSTLSFLFLPIAAKLPDNQSAS